MNKSGKILGAAVLAAGVMLSGLGPARADDVGDGIAKAGELYGAGDLGGALQELAFATAEIQAKLSAAYGETMPDAPEGWSADEPESQSMMGMGQNVTRDYTAPDGNSVRLTLSVDSPLMQSMGMLFGNPMMAAQAGYKRMRVSGMDAMVKDDGGSVQIMMAIGGRMLLNAESSSVPADQVKALFSAWKIDELKKLAGM
ncbi:hypothetical protein L2U69_18505 [Zavarzinia compransoris]|uniref:hypothetical protein n=1 Tax=Zavarzinia marina TaxID=2911065 RepID=UPI001F4744CC|nr:hypothetical protein [Zavarzinia marina]MCF4167644.1 hypothetical protein [Zavarzinia marina]